VGCLKDLVAPVDEHLRNHPTVGLLGLLRLRARRRRRRRRCHPLHPGELSLRNQLELCVLFHWSSCWLSGGADKTLLIFSGEASSLSREPRPPVERLRRR